MTFASPIAAPAFADFRQEIAFIDLALPDHETLARHIAPGIDVMFLDAARDGLAQIAAALAGNRDVAALHLFSHGAPGMLQLGSARLTLPSLDAHGAALAAIRAALADDGDLLLYGCDVARGAEGEAFLDALALATGAESAYWLGELGSGHLDRGDMLLGLADSAEKIALVGVVSTSIETI